MNLQGVTIIFIIIFLPIFLIATFFIQSQVDTINLQVAYDSKLLSATSDAISAFEINTANENLSMMSDSLRSMIEASNNVFTNTLATSLGMSGASQSKILPYIPAIVYTLYDGYYIYAPTQEPKVVADTSGVIVRVGDPGVRMQDDGYTKNGSPIFRYYPNDSTKSLPDNFKSSPNNQYVGEILYCITSNSDPHSDEAGQDGIKCTVDTDSAYYTTKYILKSFTPYTMRYKQNDEFDITINYTLDNYISISGNKKVNNVDVYYTKSGYLINFDEINEIIINDGEGPNQEYLISDNPDIDYTYDEIDDLLSKDSSFVKIEFNDGTVVDSSSTDTSFSKDYSGSSISDAKSSAEYYLKAYIFSKWVKDNFGDLSELDIQYESKQLQDDFKIKQNGISLRSDDNDDKLFYSYSNKKIFKTNDIFNVDNSESNFYEHKRNVIKNSIQYNLNIAMAVYNAGLGDEYYQMPILSEPEWDRVLSNISIISFMQGIPCGLKTYNNYAIVTSNNNQIMANLDDIYYVPIYYSTDGVKTSENTIGSLDTAHHIDCVESDWVNSINSAKYFESFPSKEEKYDKVYSATQRKYIFDHVVKTCYYCIVNRNYDHEIRNAIKEFKDNNNGTLNNEYPKIGGVEIDKTFISKLVNAEKIASAKIKNNSYKSVGYSSNYGFYNLEINRSMMSGNILTQADKDNLKKYGINNNQCYSISFVVDVKRANTSGNSYIKLGGDQSVNLSDGIQEIEFKNRNNWNEGEILLSYDKIKDRYTGNEIDSNKIISLTIKSITFKYK